MPYEVGPGRQLSGVPFRDLIPRGTWEDIQCCQQGPGCECICTEDCACECAECACGPELSWHYGPTASDPDPGKMWCYGCGGEVLVFEGFYVCSCGRQSES